MALLTALRAPLGALLFSLLQLEAHAGTLTVVNNTSSYITVNVDDNYGCNTADHTTCTIPVSSAAHDLRATRSDNSKSATTSMAANSDMTWTLTDGSSWSMVIRPRSSVWPEIALAP